MTTWTLPWNFLGRDGRADQMLGFAVDPEQVLRLPEKSETLGLITSKGSLHGTWCRASFTWKKTHATSNPRATVLNIYYKWCTPPQVLSASSRLTTSLRLLPVASVFPYLRASFGVSRFLFAFTMENLAPPSLAPPHPELNTTSKDAPSLCWWWGYVTNEKLCHFPSLPCKADSYPRDWDFSLFWGEGKSNLLLQQFCLVPLVTVPTPWSCSLWIQSSSQLEEEMGSWQRPL